jgi:regulator of replication initiation timing
LSNNGKEKGFEELTEANAALHLELSKLRADYDAVLHQNLQLVQDNDKLKSQVATEKELSFNATKEKMQLEVLMGNK